MHQIHTPMRRSVILAGVGALLYGLGGCSNTGGDLKSLAKGAMAHLTVSSNAAPAPGTPFKDSAGKTHSLSEFKGRAMIVNIWANWCAPCKAEIPSLAKLAAAYAGKPLAIIPISVGKGEDETAGAAFIARNPPLAFYSDPAYALPYALDPPAADIPLTILYDAHGHERARLAGGADWSSPEAKAVIDALLAGR